MESFGGKLAVVTGAGSGMGRELVLQLSAAGCRVAGCDIRASSVEAGGGVTGHVCDVSDEAQVLRFRDEVMDQHDTEHVDLVFNNAGIGGGGSLFTDSRESWDRTFAVDFWGVYYCTRAFLPLLVESEEGVLVNTSSLNGFWASLGPGIPHTAYSTAKFAVKGFTESLIEDLRTNAPHVRVAVVMPGHIGTDIVRNSRVVLGGGGFEDMTPEEVTASRAAMTRRGFPADTATDDDVRKLAEMGADMFRDSAPMTAAAAATIILEAVLAGRWRILVGDDAQRIDAAVRADPEAAYEHTMVGLSTLPGGGS